MADPTVDPRRTVESNYDQIAANYLAWTSNKKEETPRLQWIEKLLAHVASPSASRMLEIGCGAGVPGTQELARRCGHVIAVDISRAQIELARAHVKGTNVEFVHGDATAQAFPNASLDGVVGLYSVIHMPRNDQPALFQHVYQWLKPGGVFTCNLSIRNEESIVDDWLGGTMFWSAFDAETNERNFRDAGFTVLEKEVVEENEDGRMIPFQWFLVRKD